MPDGLISSKRCDVIKPAKELPGLAQDVYYLTAATIGVWPLRMVTQRPVCWLDWRFR